MGGELPRRQISDTLSIVKHAHTYQWLREEGWLQQALWQQFFINHFKLKYIMKQSLPITEWYVPESLLEACVPKILKHKSAVIFSEPENSQLKPRKCLFGLLLFLFKRFQTGGEGGAFGVFNVINVLCSSFDCLNQGASCLNKNSPHSLDFISHSP